MIHFFWLAAVIVSCNNDKNEKHAGHDPQDVSVYTCPMHPEIVSNTPGTCPICGMDLIKKEKETMAGQNDSHDSLLRHSNELVVSSVPVTSRMQKDVTINLEVPGTVNFDTRQIGTISSRVNGRIEKLYSRYQYQQVFKGQKIMEVYSPELSTAQQNLLFLLQNDPANTSLINSAKQRLLLLGVTNEELLGIIRSKKILQAVPVYSALTGFIVDPGSIQDQRSENDMVAVNRPSVLKEGMYLSKGQAAFSVYNSDQVWILLDLFPDQQAMVKVGTGVQIVPETSPDKIFPAKIKYLEPVFRQGSKTLIARVYFNNSKARLPVGSRVRGTIKVIQQGYWIPRESVLSLGLRKIVFVKDRNGFRARQITAGIANDGLIQVLKGISSADSIAVNAQYLIDNESFIQMK